MATLIGIAKVLTFNISMIFIGIAIGLFVFNIGGIIERLKNRSLNTFEKALEKDKKALGILPFIFLFLYEHKDGVIYGISAVGILLSVFHAYLEICYSSPYVPYKVFMGCMGTLLLISIALFNNINSGLRETNKELRGISKSIGRLEARYENERNE